MLQASPSVLLGQSFGLPAISPPWLFNTSGHKLLHPTISHPRVPPCSSPQSLCSLTWASSHHPWFPRSYQFSGLFSLETSFCIKLIISGGFWKRDAPHWACRILEEQRLQASIPPSSNRGGAGALQLLSATKHLTSKSSHRTSVISSPACFLPQVLPTHLLQLNAD